MKKTIGILGGMGPLATADLFRKIVLSTDAACDNDHIRVYIDSNSAIADRTAAILSGGKDPVPEMADALRHLESCGADCIVMPCNTAHHFLPRLQEMTATPFISMPKATAKACRETFPGKTAAVLATKGTIAVGIYDRALEEEGVSYLLPDAAEQDALMRVIYEGVKAGAEPASYREDMELVLQGMTRRGADYFILGCTELPLAFDLLQCSEAAVDPTAELAKAAVLFCGGKLKKI